VQDKRMVTMDRL